MAASLKRTGDTVKLIENFKRYVRDKSLDDNRFYGGTGTIHSTGYVDVEVDKNGDVVSVWFRCSMLPFKQHNVDEARAADMRRGVGSLPEIDGIVFRRDNGE